MVDVVNQEENPIKEADKESVDRLFNLDPQFLTRENIALLVDKLRKGRGTWIAAQKKASSSRKKLSSEAAKDVLNQFSLNF